MESHTRRGVSAALVANLLAVLCTAGIVRGAAGPEQQPGVFALLGGTPRIAAKFWVSNAAGLTRTLNVRQFTTHGEPILNYDVDMEHTMHMIVVRDDFGTFAHLHPDFDATTGTFSQSFTKEPHRQYYVYADSKPRGFPQQVFRFSLDGPGPLVHSRLVFAPSAPTAAAGPYRVTLSQTTLAAGRPKNLDLTVLENEKPAQNLTPYLGAAAHVVVINTVSLDYVHLHPALRATNGTNSGMTAGMNMAMSTQGKSGPLMSLAVPALPAGTYKMWVEFLRGDKLYTAPFTLLAR